MLRGFQMLCVDGTLHSLILFLYFRNRALIYVRSSYCATSEISASSPNQTSGVEAALPVGFLNPHQGLGKHFRMFCVIADLRSLMSGAQPIAVHVFPSLYLSFFFLLISVSS